MADFSTPRLQPKHKQYAATTTSPNITMAGKYELLCLENPLLDIQGVGYVLQRVEGHNAKNGCLKHADKSL
jgi:hypothetical protein